MGSDLTEVFKYHAPTEDQVVRYGVLRSTALALAIAIEDNCPPSADRSAAIRKVREAVMTANAAIALEGFV